MQDVTPNSESHRPPTLQAIRERAAHRMIWAVLPIGSVVVTILSINEIRDGSFWLGISYIAMFTAIIAALFMRRLNYSVRAGTPIVCAVIVAASEYYTYGLTSIALVYLLAAVAMAGLLFGAWHAIGVMVFAAVLNVVFGLLHVTGVVVAEPQDSSISLDLTVWVIMTCNLLLLGSIVIILIALLLQGLDRSIHDAHRYMDAFKRETEERLAMEKQLRQSQRLEALGSLAGGIAHDFNNLLTGVLGYSNLAQEEEGQSETTREYLRQIQTSAETAADLIRKILIFSRNVPSDIKPIDPAKVVRHSVDVVRGGLPASIELTVETGYNIPIVRADPILLQQVIVNLCTNSIQAMENTSGTVKVSVSSASRGQIQAERIDVEDAELYCTITVADDGPGMEQEVADRAFDPFFSTKGIEGGSGLGLAMAHGTLQNIGGAIALDTKPGAGATFTLYLPCTTEVVAADPPPDADADADPHDAQGVSILVVDDEPMLIDIVKRALGRLGYQVHGFLHARTALDRLSDGSLGVRVVITDLSMPEVDGIAFANEVRKLHPDVPIILMTGYSRDLEEIRSECPAIIDIVRKPFRPQELASAVRSALTK